jgi:hypothetical protein
MYVLATLYVSPFLDDYSKPFMQTRAAWAEELGLHADMVMGSRCWPGDHMCGLGWIKVLTYTVLTYAVLTYAVLPHTVLTCTVLTYRCATRSAGRR